MTPNQVAGARRWRLQFRCRERKAPWGHAPLRGSRRESAVAFYVGRSPCVIS